MPVRSRSPAPSISAQIYAPLPVYLFLFYAMEPTITKAAIPIKVIGYEVRSKPNQDYLKHGVAKSEFADAQRTM